MGLWSIMTYHPQGRRSRSIHCGIRTDGQILCPSIAGGLKTDVQIADVNAHCCLHRRSGAAAVRAGDRNGDWGTIVGSGAKVEFLTGMALLG